MEMWVSVDGSPEWRAALAQPRTDGLFQYIPETYPGEQLIVDVTGTMRIISGGEK